MKTKIAAVVIALLLPLGLAYADPVGPGNDNPVYAPPIDIPPAPPVDVPPVDVPPGPIAIIGLHIGLQVDAITRTCLMALGITGRSLQFK
ncbi:MAG: hypothetical protein V3R83_04510 [Gammaproteobacteria bacterium]